MWKEQGTNRPPKEQEQRYVQQTQLSMLSYSVRSLTSTVQRSKDSAPSTCTMCCSRLLTAWRLSSCATAFPKTLEMHGSGGAKGKGAWVYFIYVQGSYQVSSGCRGRSGMDLSDCRGHVQSNFFYHVVSESSSPAHGCPVRHLGDSWTRLDESSYVESSSI